jgi:hypothetical protein
LKINEQQKYANTILSKKLPQNNMFSVILFIDFPDYRPN